jgi:hypothetical protein
MAVGERHQGTAHSRTDDDSGTAVNNRTLGYGAVS